MMPRSARPRGRRRLVAILAVALASAMLTILLNAPAAWLGLACEHLSDGRALLGEAEGTIWNGAATLVLAGTSIDTRTRLPGRIHWNVSQLSMLRARLDVVLTADVAPAQAIRVQIDRRGATHISGGTALFPARLLTGLGAPWNTIRPRGTLTIDWTPWDSDARGGGTGALRLLWTDAASALCPVDPLGSYRLSVAGWTAGAAVHLETLSGPMDLSGDGTIGGPSLIRFRAKARVREGTDERIANQVASVVALLGPRDGDGAALQIGM